MAALLAKALAIAVISYSPGYAAPTCPRGAGACASPPGGVIIKTSWWSDTANRFVPIDSMDLLSARNHELGHIIDYNLLTDQDRGMFLALAHTTRSWIDPPNSPHEQFAEAFRLCAISTRWVSHYQPIGFGYWPTLYQHRKVCRWMATIGGR